MSQLQVQLTTDAWVPASWNEYLNAVEALVCQDAKGYYYWGCMRLEMLPVGFDHGINHSLIALAINLFGILNGIPLTMADACSYRKVGIQESQPDLSVYVGTTANAIPKETTIVNLDRYPPPNLVVEISKTTLLDDIGTKRSLYEEMGVQEYWIVDVKNVQIVAYQVHARGSQRIHVSQVLPNLKFATLDEALRRSQHQNQSEIGAWLIQQFQA
jgi:Uma2 family endonuclease